MIQNRFANFCIGMLLTLYPCVNQAFAQTVEGIGNSTFTLTVKSIEKTKDDNSSIEFTSGERMKTDCERRVRDNVLGWGKGLVTSKGTPYYLDSPAKCEYFQEMTTRALEAGIATVSVVFDSVSGKVAFLKVEPKAINDADSKRLTEESTQRSRYEHVSSAQIAK